MTASEAWGDLELATAQAVLQGLLRRGWTAPAKAGVEPGPIVDPGADTDPLSAELAGAVVRSLAEDLAVARLRAATARDDAGRTRDRATAAGHVSHDLGTDNAHEQARARRETRRRKGRAVDRDQHRRPAVSMASLVQSASTLASESSVVAWALETIPTATVFDEAALNLTDGMRETFPGGLADSCEQFQAQLLEGPTVDAFSSKQPVRFDTAARSPWPRWSAAATRLGVGAALAVPLGPASAPLGVLTLYAAAPAEVGEEEVEAAAFVGALVSLCLQHTRRAANLHQGMENRTVIGQAQGLLMERYAIDPGSTFAILERLASSGQRSLFQVAVDLVRTRTLPSSPTSTSSSRHSELAAGGTT